MTLLPPVTPEKISHLIGLIYDCALDPARWKSTLTALRLELGFKNAAMQIMSMPGGNDVFGVISGVEPHWLENMNQYGADVVAQWGGAAKIQSLPLDEPAVLSWENEPANWVDNRYYVEWGKPQGIVDVMAVGLVRDAGMIGSIGFGRHSSAGEIGQREIEAARLLIPHLQRAVAISRVLELRSVVASSFAAALDALTAGVFLVDADVRIIHVNTAAAGMLQAGDTVRSAGGRLALHSQSANIALRDAIRMAAEAESKLERQGFGVPAPGSAGRPSIVHVLPLQHTDLRSGISPSAAAAVFVAPSTAVVPTEAIARLFDLTPAELVVFSRIVQGSTVGEIAAELGIGRATVKTHLLHLFAKTGTKRQAELVKLGHSFSMPA